MKKNLLVLFEFFFAYPIVVQSQNNLKLWYDKPAQTWTEALPVSNGRLGAMAWASKELAKVGLALLNGDV